MVCIVTVVYRAIVSCNCSFWFEKHCICNIVLYSHSCYLNLGTWEFFLIRTFNHAGLSLNFTIDLYHNWKHLMLKMSFPSDSCLVVFSGLDNLCLCLYSWISFIVWNGEIGPRVSEIRDRRTQYYNQSSYFWRGRLVQKLCYLSQIYYLKISLEMEIYQVDNWISRKHTAQAENHALMNFGPIGIL